MVREKNIAVSVILSLITCGIYGLYWITEITRDVDNISKNPQPRSGGMVILLSIITCGIYSFYWWYQNGQLMEKANRESNLSTTSNAVLYLILSIFGLAIVNYVLIQSDINKYANNKTI